MGIRTVRCKDCGCEIHNVGHGMSMGGAPVVCQKCFGVQTYANVIGKVWVYSPMTAERPAIATVVD